MMRTLAVSLLMGALLCGCALPQIRYGQLAALDKGQAPADVVARLQLAPTAVHKVQAEGRSFEFYQYRMNNGVQADHYLLAFEGGKLVYWGYLDEFRKQPDKALAAAAGQIAPAVIAAR